MAREIKFRAWVKEYYEDGEFVYGGYMIEPSLIKKLVLSNVSMLMNGRQQAGIEYFEQGPLLPNLGTIDRLAMTDIELMQYTGLKDKNGVEIYEGDVVKGRYFANGRDNRIIGTVEYAGVGFRVVGVKKYQGWPCELNSLFEVIGNIYENADLLANTVSE